MAQRSMAGVRARTRAAQARVQANRRPNADIPAANLRGTRGDTTARNRAAGLRAAQAQAERQARQQQLVGMGSNQKLIYNPTTNRYRAVSRGMRVPAGYQNVGGQGQLSVMRTNARGTAVRTSKARY